MPITPGMIKSAKAKIPKHKKIKDALKKASPGSIFSTPRASKIYVVTKSKWGKKSKGNIARGYSADTPMDKIRASAHKVKYGDEVKPPDVPTRKIKLASRDNAYSRLNKLKGLDKK